MMQFEICDRLLRVIEEDDSITKASPIKILDLGFGDPGNFYKLFNYLNIEYVGVDVIEKEQFSVEFPNEIGRKNIDSILSHPLSPYEYFMTFQKLLKSNCVVSEQRFKKMFRFYFETEVLEFLIQSNNHSYSIVVLSKILHLFPDKVKYHVFSESLAKLKSRGILYCSYFMDDLYYDSLSFNPNGSIIPVNNKFHLWAQEQMGASSYYELDKIHGICTIIFRKN